MRAVERGRIKEVRKLNNHPSYFPIKRCHVVPLSGNKGLSPNSGSHDPLKRTELIYVVSGYWRKWFG
jgi:hypothetical protein